MKDVKVNTRAVSARDRARAENSKRHRRRRKRSYMLYYILLLLFVLIAFVTLSVTVFFNISDIQVTGISKLSAQEVIAASGLEKGDNLFRSNLKGAQKKVEQSQVYADSVKMVRKLPSTLVIQVTEAVPTVNLKTGDTYAVLSAKGRVLEVNQQKPNDKLITLEGIKKDGLKRGDFLDYEGDEKLSTLGTIVEALEEVGFQGIKGINLENLVDIRLNYKDRIRIDLGSISDLSYKLTFAKDIVENRLKEDSRGIIRADKANEMRFQETVSNPNEPVKNTSSTASGGASSGSSSGASSSGTGSGGTGSSGTPSKGASSAAASGASSGTNTSSKAQ